MEEPLHCFVIFKRDIIVRGACSWFHPLEQNTLTLDGRIRAKASWTVPSLDPENLLRS
jgi:hypothetical protein